MRPCRHRYKRPSIRPGSKFRLNRNRFGSYLGCLSGGWARLGSASPTFCLMGCRTELAVISFQECVATHEAGHCVAALAYGIPIVSVAIDNAPNMHRGAYKAAHACGLERLHGSVVRGAFAIITARHFEMMSKWRAVLEKKHGRGVAHKTLRVWRTWKWPRLLSIPPSPRPGAAQSPNKLRSRRIDGSIRSCIVRKFGAASMG
jgi:hypothetical protein